MLISTTHLFEYPAGVYDNLRGPEAEDLCGPEIHIFLTMTEITDKNLSDLPDEMKQGFVSCEGDYDFPLYLSTKEEFVNNEEKKKERIEIDEEAGIEPFLIMELQRFVPYLEKPLLKFHPLNMPHKEIGVIEIAGVVLDIYETDKFYQYTVDDGTGVIIIYYRKMIKNEIENERRKIDDKYITHLSSGEINVDLLEIDICSDKYPEPRPGFKYPKGTRIEDTLIFEHNWSFETKNGTRGKPIELCTYISAKGQCLLKFLDNIWDMKEIPFHDLPYSQLIFMAEEVSGLTERQYNDKVLSWIETNVQKRYNKGPLESFKDVDVPIFNMIL